MKISIQQGVNNNLIPSFWTQLLMYFTALLPYFQMDIWIQEYINGCIKAALQGSDVSGNAEIKRQALVIKNVFKANGRPSYPKQGLLIWHCYCVFYSLLTKKDFF